MTFNLNRAYSFQNTTKFILSLILGTLLLSNCTTKKKDSEGATIASNKPSEFVQLSDSLNNSWNNMMDADDKKLLFVKRLAEEISYTPQPDPIRIEQIKAYQQKVKNLRYTQFNLSEKDKIDLYDRSTDSLLRAVYQLASTTPNIERYPLINELVGDINALDNQTVIYRARYDRWVKQYNAYLEKQLEEIKAVYPDCTTISPLGMFELQE